MEIINLDMTPSTVTPNAHAGQYDSARTVRFMLKNGGVPFTLAGTETITAEVTRSDNTEVTVNVENTSSNYVDVVFDDTVCTVKGLYACELRLKDSDGFDIGSKNFALLVQRDPYDGAGVRIVTVGPADICTFETTLPEPYQSVTVDILASGGNGTPDNPNPINGYTEANITRCGVNLWDEDWEVGNIDGSGADSPANDRIRSKGYIQVKGATSIYLVIPTAVVIHKYGVDKSYLGNNYVASSGSFTIASDVAYVRFRTDTSYGTTYNNDISILYPSDTTPDYHAYNGQTYTIAFGQTVYGGVLDVTRGKLTVTWGSVDLGTLPWVHYSITEGHLFRAIVDDMKLTEGSTINAICSIYATVAQSNRANNTISSSVNTRNVDAIDNRYSNAATYKTAMAGTLLVYELATPFDIDLTPEVISAVVGTNNVFADCGQTTVKYLKAGV